MNTPPEFEEPGAADILDVDEEQGLLAKTYLWGRYAKYNNLF